MTFTKSPTTLTLSGSLYPCSVEFKQQQLAGISADGDVLIRDRSGADEVFVKIVLPAKHNNYDSIRDFITDTVKMRKETFTFTPDSGVDVGAGDGVGIYVKYWSDNFTERMRAWGSFVYEIILRKTGNLT